MNNNAQTNTFITGRILSNIENTAKLVCTNIFIIIYICICIRSSCSLSCVCTQCIPLHTKHCLKQYTEPVLTYIPSNIPRSHQYPSCPHSISLRIASYIICIPHTLNLLAAVPTDVYGRHTRRRQY